MQADQAHRRRHALPPPMLDRQSEYAEPGLDCASRAAPERDLVIHEAAKTRYTSISEEAPVALFPQRHSILTDTKAVKCLG